MHNHHQKQCRYCGRFFCPNRRLINSETGQSRQKACGRSECRERRKREAHQKWLNANPDAFKGRYDNTKAWRESHPGWQNAWRAGRRSGVCQTRALKDCSAEIQDAIRPETRVKSISLWYRPGQQVRYKTRSGWEVAIDAASP